MSQEIRINCAYCLENNFVSLELDHFICRECGERNALDNEKFKAQHRAIIRKVFGTKPDKPENN